MVLTLQDWLLGWLNADTQPRAYLPREQLLVALFCKFFYQYVLPNCLAPSTIRVCAQRVFPSIFSVGLSRFFPCFVLPLSHFKYELCARLHKNKYELCVYPHILRKEPLIFSSLY